jgi:hypothetical protein
MTHPRIIPNPHREPKAAAETFAPVPSASTRHDGWTPQRQQDFIANLAQTGVVSAAARAVGMSPKSAYALRKRAGEDSGFAAAWDEALDLGRREALDTAIDRALHGEQVPVFYGGLQVGEYRRYNDGLLIAAIRASSPDARNSPRYPGDAPWEL